MEHAALRQRLTTIFENRPYFRGLFYYLIDYMVVSFWHIRRGINQFAKSHQQKTVHVLDAGCGLGQYEYFITRKFKHWNILGIDNCQTEVGECNEFFTSHNYQRVLFKTACLCDLNYRASFDLVLAVNVLEFVEQDEKVLSNLFQSLKPGGQILIAVQSDKAKKAMPNFTNKIMRNQPLVHRYNNLAFKKKLKELGFVNIRGTYAYGVTGRISTNLGVVIPKWLLRNSEIWLYLMPFYYLMTYPFIFILNLIDTYFNHISGTELVVRANKPA